MKYKQLGFNVVVDETNKFKDIISFYFDNELVFSYEIFKGRESKEDINTLLENLQQFKPITVTQNSFGSLIMFNNERKAIVKSITKINPKHYHLFNNLAVL